MEEVWKDVVGFEGLYKVSNFGEVWSTRRNQMLKLLPNSKGYLRVHLNKEGKTYFKRVHRIVAEAFIGDINGMEINHIDYDVTNNRVDNLEIVTRDKNLSHSGKRLSRCILGISIHDGSVIAFKYFGEANRKGYNSIQYTLKSKKGYYRDRVWKVL